MTIDVQTRPKSKTRQEVEAAILVRLQRGPASPAELVTASGSSSYQPAIDSLVRQGLVCRLSQGLYDIARKQPGASGPEIAKPRKYRARAEIETAINLRLADCKAHSYGDLVVAAGTTGLRHLLRLLELSGDIKRLQHGWYCAGHAEPLPVPPKPASSLPHRKPRQSPTNERSVLASRILEALTTPATALTMSLRIGITQRQARDGFGELLAAGIITARHTRNGKLHSRTHS